MFKRICLLFFFPVFSFSAMAGDLNLQCHGDSLSDGHIRSSAECEIAVTIALYHVDCKATQVHCEKDAEGNDEYNCKAVARDCIDPSEEGVCPHGYRLEWGKRAFTQRSFEGQSFFAAWSNIDSSRKSAIEWESANIGTCRQED